MSVGRRRVEVNVLVNCIAIIYQRSLADCTIVTGQLLHTCIVLVTVCFPAEVQLPHISGETPALFGS